ncbi:hypothetical protein EYF80_009610 [Liparis tanakae]|uniref:Uncharacterized protein n=1 Tax=Liparis tanakae TaxID=230148 RepID=A0A4Z2IQ61_9TELE|nr:hypothetical protein EYF80_009610 [Liparis tanakae]
MENLETSRVEEWAESQQGSGTAGGRNSRPNHRWSISRWDLFRLIGSDDPMRREVRRTSGRKQSLVMCDGEMKIHP